MLTIRLLQKYIWKLIALVELILQRLEASQSEHIHHMSNETNVMPQMNLRLSYHLYCRDLYISDCSIHTYTIPAVEIAVSGKFDCAIVY